MTCLGEKKIQKQSDPNHYNAKTFLPSMYSFCILVKLANLSIVLSSMLSSIPSTARFVSVKKLSGIGPTNALFPVFHNKSRKSRKEDEAVDAREDFSYRNPITNLY